MAPQSRLVPISPNCVGTSRVQGLFRVLDPAPRCAHWHSSGGGCCCCALQQSLDRPRPTNSASEARDERYPWCGRGGGPSTDRMCGQNHGPSPVWKEDRERLCFLCLYHCARRPSLPRKQCTSPNLVPAGLYGSRSLPNPCYLQTQRPTQPMGSC